MNNKKIARLMIVVAAGFAFSVVKAADTELEASIKKQPQVSAGTGTTQSLPNSKLGKDFIRMQNSARAVAEAKRIQQLREIEQARQGSQRGEQPLDRAAGTALGGRTFDTNRAAASERQAGSQGRDCIRNPADCVTPAGHRGALLGQPGSPAGGMIKGDRGAAASDESWSEYVPSDHESDDGTTHLDQVDYKKTDNSSGGQDGSAVRTRSDGTTTVYQWTTGRDGNVNSARQTEIDAPDAQGYRDWSSSKKDSSGQWREIDSGRYYDPNNDNRPDTPPGHGPAGQPGETDAGTGGNNNCNWNFILGRCTKQRVSAQDMTSQPSRAEGGSTASGASARPYLGSDAVTNPGDAGFAATRGGHAGKGQPYDPRDPSGAFGPGVPNPASEKH